MRLHLLPKLAPHRPDRHPLAAHVMHDELTVADGGHRLQQELGLAIGPQTLPPRAGSFDVPIKSVGPRLDEAAARSGRRIKLTVDQSPQPGGDREVRVAGGSLDPLANGILDTNLEGFGARHACQLDDEYRRLGELKWPSSPFLSGCLTKWRLTLSSRREPQLPEDASGFGVGFRADILATQHV